MDLWTISGKTQGRLRTERWQLLFGTWRPWRRHQKVFLHWRCHQRVLWAEQPKGKHTHIQVILKLSQSCYKHITQFGICGGARWWTVRQQNNSMWAWKLLHDDFRFHLESGTTYWKALTWPSNNWTSAPHLRHLRQLLRKEVKHSKQNAKC